MYSVVCFGILCLLNGIVMCYGLCGFGVEKVCSVSERLLIVCVIGLVVDISCVLIVCLGDDVLNVGMWLSDGWILCMLYV